jgi:hypothetical protein
MQINVSFAQVFSRVAAVLLLAAPAAWVINQLAIQEHETINRLGQKELLQYLNEGYNPSFAGSYLWMLCLTLGFTAAVEGIGFVFRSAAGMLKPAEPAPAPQL